MQKHKDIAAIDDAIAELLSQFDDLRQELRECCNRRYNAGTDLQEHEELELEDEIIEVCLRFDTWRAKIEGLYDRRYEVGARLKEQGRFDASV